MFKILQKKVIAKISNSIRKSFQKFRQRFHFQTFRSNLQDCESTKLIIGAIFYQFAIKAFVHANSDQFHFLIQKVSLRKKTMKGLILIFSLFAASNAFPTFFDSDSFMGLGNINFDASDFVNEFAETLTKHLEEVNAGESEEVAPYSEEPEAVPYSEEPVPYSEEPEAVPYTEEPIAVPYKATEEPIAVPYKATEEPIAVPYKATEEPIAVPYKATEEPIAVPYKATEEPIAVPYKATEEPIAVPYSEEPEAVPYSEEPVPYKATEEPIAVPYKIAEEDMSKPEHVPIFTVW
jgi:hypothetical protein